MYVLLKLMFESQTGFWIPLDKEESFALGKLQRKGIKINNRKRLPVRMGKREGTKKMKK